MVANNKRTKHKKIYEQNLERIENMERNMRHSEMVFLDILIRSFEFNIVLILVWFPNQI